MSGGAFSFNQHRIYDIIDTIKDIIRENGKKKPEDERWGDDDLYYYEYPSDIIEKFKEAVNVLNKAYIYAQRIDWLLSGDDGEESFLERLAEELNKLDNENK